MKQYKKWCIKFVIVFVVLLLITGGFSVVVDPYFHYHKPLKCLEYPIDNERYQNDGIIKHFDYDAIIIGSSLVSNFKTSELDELFEVHSIKVPFPSGTYREVNDNLERAVANNPDIKIVVRGLDWRMLLYPKDTRLYSAEVYPTYLYDTNVFNDVKYIYNKEIMKETVRVFSYTNDGNLTTTFDDYGSSPDECCYGKEAVDATYERIEEMQDIVALSETDITNMQENLQQNVIDLVEANPDIDFYFFFPPCSIYHFDNMRQNGELEKQLQAHKYAIEMLLPYENVHLYSFFEETDMICDLNNYSDIVHYGKNVNSQMLLWMSQEQYLLTEENYQDYYDHIYEFYCGYDYDALFHE